MALPSSPSFNLQGKRALVAGASSGIGAACAVALSRAGAHVVLAARRQSQLDELVKEIRQEGFAAEALVMDVARLPPCKS